MFNTICSTKSSDELQSDSIELLDLASNVKACLTLFNSLAPISNIHYLSYSNYWWIHNLSYLNYWRYNTCWKSSSTIWLIFNRVARLSMNGKTCVTLFNSLGAHLKDTLLKAIQIITHIIDDRAYDRGIIFSIQHFLDNWICITCNGKRWNK